MKMSTFNFPNVKMAPYAACVIYIMLSLGTHFDVSRCDRYLYPSAAICCILILKMCQKKLENVPKKKR